MNSALAISDPKLLILALIVVLNVVFAFYVLLRNWGGAVNRSFFLFVLSLVFWAVTIIIFFSVRDLQVARLAMQSAYLAAILIAWSFFNFANVFAFRYLKFHTLNKISLAGLTMLTMVVVFWPKYLVQAVYINDGARDVVLNRLGHLVFAFYFFTFTAAILYTFIKKYFKSDGVIKIQLKYMALGCFLTLGLGIFFNLVLPGVGNHKYIWLGPYFSFAVTLFAGYTIQLAAKIR